MVVFMRGLLAASIFVSMLPLSAADTSATLPRGPYPFVFTTSETLANAAKRADRLEWAGKIRNNLLKDAEAVLSTTLTIPEMGGQWRQHYNCRDCGTKLNYKNQRHLCAKCGREYTGWPYDQVIAADGHIRNWESVKNLAVAYGLTGDLRFAQRARDILIGYAQRYTSFPYHDYQGGTLPKGARILAQTLDESVRVLDLVYGYDIIHDSPAVSQADRDQIDNQLLREVAKTIRRHDAGISNWQTWHNAAFASIGAVIGDEALFDHAINGKSGVHFQLAKSVLADGFWYEGTAGYHFYSLDALRHTAEAARCAGLDLYAQPRLKAMFDAPLNYMFPDGHFPAVNDSDDFSIYKRSEAYEIALARYHDPVYSSGIDAARRNGLEALLYGVDEIPTTASRTVSSASFPGLGAVMLKQGQGKKQVCVHLDYGPHGGAHGHFDKLGIIVFAHGKVVAPDPARLAYSVPMHKTWYKTTLAHNTLVVDGKDQAPTTGSLDYLKTLDGTSVAQARCDSAYDGVAMVRTVAVTDRYVLDIVTAHSEAPHTYDLAYHLYGEAKPGFEIRTTTVTLGTEGGYQHLKDVREAVPGESWSIDYINGGSRVRQTTLASPDTQVFLGTGISDNPPRPCPATLVRTRGRSAQYITVLEPVGREPLVNAVRAEQQGRDRMRVHVTGSNFKDVFTLNMKPHGKSGDDPVQYVRTAQ